MEILTKAGSIHTSLLLQVPAPHLETPMLGDVAGCLPHSVGGSGSAGCGQAAVPTPTLLPWHRVPSSWGGCVFFSEIVLSERSADWWIFVSIRTMLVFANPFKLLSASASASAEKPAERGGLGGGSRSLNPCQVSVPQSAGAGTGTSCVSGCCEQWQAVSVPKRPH